MQYTSSILIIEVDDARLILNETGALISDIMRFDSELIEPGVDHGDTHLIKFMAGIIHTLIRTKLLLNP